MGLDYSMQLIMSGVLNVTQVSLRLFPTQTLSHVAQLYLSARRGELTASNLVFHTSLRQIMSPTRRLCFMDFLEPSSFEILETAISDRLPLAHRRNQQLVDNG